MDALKSLQDEIVEKLCTLSCEKLEELCVYLHITKDRSCYALRHAVRDAKHRYREHIESHFQLNDSRRMWQGLRTICALGNKSSAEVRADPLLADELNTFYGRFESNLSSASLPISAPGSSSQSSDNQVIAVSEDEVRRALKRVNIRKAAGPDGISGRNRSLQLVAANGTNMPYCGWVEMTFKLASPGTTGRELIIPVLVLKDQELSRPIIGYNFIEQIMKQHEVKKKKKMNLKKKEVHTFINLVAAEDPKEYAVRTVKETVNIPKHTVMKIQCRSAPTASVTQTPKETISVACQSPPACGRDSVEPLKALSKEEIRQAQRDDKEIEKIIEHLQSGSKPLQQWRSASSIRRSLWRE
ncbi:uncharacterized protein LOC113067551 [Tachysurus ichikawai]